MKDEEKEKLTLRIDFLQKALKEQEGKNNTLWNKYDTLKKSYKKMIDELL